VEWRKLLLELSASAAALRVHAATLALPPAAAWELVATPPTQ
jgi:hypothetical protein